jgi:hypothetical protein
LSLPLPATKPEREIPIEIHRVRWTILKWIERKKQDMRVRTRFNWLRIASR